MFHDDPTGRQAPPAVSTASDISVFCSNFSQKPLLPIGKKVLDHFRLGALFSVVTPVASFFFEEAGNLGMYTEKFNQIKLSNFLFRSIWRRTLRDFVEFPQLSAKVF